MDRWVYIPSVVLGLFFIITYCLRCLRRDEKVDPAKAWGGFMLGPQIVLGLLLMAGLAWERCWEIVKIDLYLAYAGVAMLMWAWLTLTANFEIKLRKRPPLAAREAAASAEMKT